MHDPAIAPDPTVWLSLDEGERVALLTAWHEANPSTGLHPHGAPPLHAAMHAAVETQIAQRSPAVVAETIERLCEAQVRRHPAVHAMMEVLMFQMHAAVNRPDGFDDEGYADALAALDPPTLIARAMRRVAAMEQRAEALRNGTADPVPNRAQRRAAKKNKQP